MPLKPVRSGNKKHFPKSIRKLLAKKAAAWRTYKTNRKASDLSTYKSVSADCLSAMNNYYTNIELSLIDDGNIGAFYRYANSKTLLKMRYPFPQKPYW